MPIEIMGKLKPVGTGTYKLMDTKDIDHGGVPLDEYLEDLGEGGSGGGGGGVEIGTVAGTAYDGALGRKLREDFDAHVEAYEGIASAMQDHTEGDENPHGVTAAQVGAIPTSDKGAAGGVATLDEGGRVPAAQLPSYVDDVLEYDGRVNFPETGEGGKIYVDLQNGLTYRWSGSEYVEISKSLAIGETDGTAFSGKAGKQLRDAMNTHIDSRINPHAVTAAQVGAIPTSDKGAAGGVATLGSDGKVPAAQLPAVVEETRAQAAANATAIAALSGVVEGLQSPTLNFPEIVDSIDQMVDTSKMYVLRSVGEIYAYKSIVTEGARTITDNVATDDNPILDDIRLSASSGGTATGYAGFVTTPWIDVTKYPYPFTLHLEGAEFLPASQTGNIVFASYDSSKTKLTAGASILDQLDSWTSIADGDVTKDSDGNVSIVIDEPLRVNMDASSAAISYIRWSGTGEPATTSVYVTYTTNEPLVTQGWESTGVKFSATVTDADKTAIAEEAAALIDTQLLSVIGEGTVTV